MAMNRRTIRDFPCSEDIWPLIESWAEQAGFVALERASNRRFYRRGGGLLMAPVFLEIRHEGGRITLEAWVKADFFLILSLLSGQKPETGIEAGGLTAALPRKRAREKINQLLKQLGQPPIT